jgi:sugar phosphate isomerase/epimerase
MGFSVYSANPSADSFESLATLTKEYGIRIAIHNHGPEDKTYGRLEQVQKAVDKWPVEIGSCVDTGHVLRIGEDPVQWIKALGPRVHDVHLKDFSGPKGEDEKTLGKGKLDVVGVLKALKEVKFSGILALEYEKNGPKLIDDIKECLETVREAAKKL